MNNINYCLIAHPRSGSTYLRYIISFFLKTYAMQPTHNNDPKFINWPPNTENSKMIHFRKYHTINNFKEYKGYLLKHSKKIRYIIIVRNPISNLKSDFKYSESYPKKIWKTEKYRNYWNNIKFIDNIDNIDDILILSYQNIVCGDQDTHYKEIKKIINFLNLPENEIENYKYDEIKSMSRSLYPNVKNVDTWFNVENMYNNCMDKIKELKNDDLKQVLIYELNQKI